MVSGCFNRECGKAVKFVDEFKYVGSNIPSTENDVCIRLANHGLLFIGY